ncbi:MAG TPA: DNA-directed DNA polymerase [Candidatus Nanoarchaeia archaeon]|nr:DNA-directed DNA polymerase [Candidatus Nanoarchaeia archaeon]
MKLKFIPIDYDYFDFEGRNYAKITGRDDKGKRICVIDSCEIYLWAILKEDLSQKKIEAIIKKISKIKLDIKGRQTKVEKVEFHDKNFLSHPVKALKIYATNYKDLHDIADKLGMKEIVKRRGYDLGFTTHYIIEKQLNPMEWYEISGELLNDSNKYGGIDKSIDVDICLELEGIKKIDKFEFTPKVLAYDIETDELQIGKGEILMVSLVSSDGFKKVISWKKSQESGQKQDYVEYVKNEPELIEAFVKYVKKISPDFLIGYFSDGFDMPYLKLRADHNKIKLSLGLDDSQPRISRGIMTSSKIKGIVHIDILKFIKTAYSQYMQSETLSLNDVANEFLGKSKKPFKHKHSSKLNGKDWAEYYEYNLHDSILTLGLFEKILPDLLEFTRIIKDPVFDVSRNGMSKNVESYILHKLGEFNEIPEKQANDKDIAERRSKERYEGGFVLEPKPGLYENIVMFDFTSSYGSVIVTYNLSKSTLLEKPSENAYTIKIKDKEVYFSKKPGFVPEILKDILEKRRKYKKELKSAKEQEETIKRARSNAFKLLANAYYGYLGFFGARYYSYEAAAATAAFARKAIKDVIRMIEKAEYDVIYSDTDSIAFARGKKNESEIETFLISLNSNLPGIMELELEGFFKRGIWVTKRSGIFGAKKKYALIDKKGNLRIRGFETVRRDWCNLARETQNKVIKYILEDGNEEKALKYVKNIIWKLKKREITKEELIIRSQLRKSLSEYKAISPHVIAARRMKEKKIPIGQGNLIEYYIAETREKKKLVREGVKLPEEPGEYDIKYYLEKQILPAVENIFQVFNINIMEIIEGKKQTTLGDF